MSCAIKILAESQLDGLDLLLPPTIILTMELMGRAASPQCHRLDKKLFQSYLSSVPVIIL